MENVSDSTQEKNKSKWATARLIIGIISIVMFPIIFFQSCAVGIGNSIIHNGENSGFAGILSSLFLLSSGIVMIATRYNIKKGASIASCIFCWNCFFLSRIFAGNYSDLRIWGIIAFLFGAFYLFTCMRTRKGCWISVGVSAIYFILGIA